MKRKFLILLASVLTLILLAFGISACGKSPANSGGSGTETPDGGEQHTHSFDSYVYNDDATCTEDGTETATCECGVTDTRTKANSKLGHEFTVENKCIRCEAMWQFSEGLEYTQNEDGTYSVSGIGSVSGDVIIPYGYQGQWVTAIGERAFYGCTAITGELKISDSVTSIGAYAFAGCSGLTSVISGNGVTSIGDYAFRDCSGLTSVTIGSGVTSIEDYAFAYCNGLTGELKIPDSVTSIGQSAFRGCSGLTGELKIPDSVTSIGDDAFYDCSGLTSVTIGSGVTSIGSYAFYDCSGLTSVEFKNPNGWYVSQSSSATSGTDLSGLDDKATAAKYLKNTYCSYYWKRK